MVEQNKIPQWAQFLLDANGAEAIESAVEKAERATSGEIVPMLVRSSSTGGHIPLTLFLASWLVLEILDPAHFFHLLEQTWAIEICYAVIAGILAVILSKVRAVQRFLIPQEDRNIQVEMRAEVEFYEAGLHQTAGRTGILLFVSLLEHRVVVLADEGISSKLPQDTWDGVVKTIVNGVRGGTFAKGFCAAIEECSQLLAEHFPIASGDVNELHNKLVIKE